MVADEIVYSAAEKKFVARGNVVATWQNEQFKADEISYDGELLKAQGPLEFSDEQGSSIIAEYGEISADFRDALLEGVELLLEGRIQIDASNSCGTTADTFASTARWRLHAEFVAKEVGRSGTFVQDPSCTTPRMIGSISGIRDSTSEMRRFSIFRGCAFQPLRSSVHQDSFFRRWNSRTKSASALRSRITSRLATTRT